jgi:hypothetical protein
MRQLLLMFFFLNSSCSLLVQSDIFIERLEELFLRLCSSGESETFVLSDRVPQNPVLSVVGMMLTTPVARGWSNKSADQPDHKAGTLHLHGMSWFVNESCSARAAQYQRTVSLLARGVRESDPRGTSSSSAGLSYRCWG